MGGHTLAEWVVKVGRNTQIEKLTKVKEWLDYIYNKNKNDFSWPDRFRAKRAWHYLELATLEMYSMQYEDPEKIPLYWRDEQIK